MLLVKLEQRINWFSDLLGKISATLFIVLLFNVFYDVITRYAFNDVSIGMQELEWHLYAAIFLLGVPYALRNEGHVRVDVIYERLSPRQQAWIDIIGTLLFLLPFSLLVGWYGVGFAEEAYKLGETSGDPGGLPYRWVIKAVIPFAFFSIAISGIGLILKSVNTLLGRHESHYSAAPPAS
jgi:TRAP-type mannitol/chloroaromatic compound transport system permease small subunit